MFDDLRPDPGERGLNRASMIFYVIAVLTIIGAALKLLLGLMGTEIFSPLRFGVFCFFAALAFVIGRGIENQKPWAKWLGYVFGVLELFSFPIGTLIGVAIIVYIYRADKAGMFAPPAVAAVPVQ